MFSRYGLGLSLWPHSPLHEQCNPAQPPREKIQTFEQAYQDLTDAFNNARNVTGAFSADRAFHQAMFRLVENPFLSAAVNRINEWLKLNVQDVVSNLFADASYRQDTHGEHEAIFNAIVDGKPQEAFEAAKQHLTKAHEKIIKKLR